MDVTHTDHILAERTPGGLGLITLNRPQALNALDLPMVRRLTALLQGWRGDPGVHAVIVRGQGKAGPFGVFCAGGDIRFFHRAALAGDPALDDFFTEEYALNHLVFTYPKPYVALMDGVVMGGGMGIAQGAWSRVVTEKTRMAMPETQIGLFPDVGGGYFLNRCPRPLGLYLALTGQTIGPGEALACGLADAQMPSSAFPGLWEALSTAVLDGREVFERFWSAKLATHSAVTPAPSGWAPEVLQAFERDSVPAIAQALERAHTEAAQQTLQTLRQRSPLMLHVVFEQMRRAQGMPLADELRMERDMVRHCFHPRHLGRRAAESETVEGIRALAVDKDHSPRWQPQRLEDVTPEMVAPFFQSPWPAQAHPLASLQDSRPA